MSETYTSEKILREVPRPLLNFLWYLWDTYYDPDEAEFRITLRGSETGQQFVIRAASLIVTQDFGCSINAEIAIRKCGKRVIMEYD